MSPKELENSEMKILQDKSGLTKNQTGKISEGNKNTPLEKLKKEHPENKDFPDNDAALEEENDA
jgi:hypothetical protein